VNVNNNPVSLSDLKGKVKIVQFTSVLCGPCRASIPFLNELASLYNNKDVDLVAIECATKSLDALNKYKNFNKINYSFLKSDKTVLDEYEIKSFPIFFVIDKDLVVREVLTGYGFGTTDTHLKNIIDKMIQ
jgi:thiol-disulfide isomerase/thioredoxin